MDGNSTLDAAKCKADRWRVCCIRFAIKEDANTSMLHTDITQTYSVIQCTCYLFPSFELSILCSYYYQ